MFKNAHRCARWFVVRSNPAQILIYQIKTFTLPWIFRKEWLLPVNNPSYMTVQKDIKNLTTFNDALCLSLFTAHWLPINTCLRVWEIYIHFFFFIKTMLNKFLALDEVASFPLNKNKYIRQNEISFSKYEKK